MNWDVNQYAVVYGVFFILALGFAFIVSSLLLKFATNLGIRNPNDKLIRWSSSAKPALGGFVFYILFLLSIVFYLIVFSENSPFNNIEFLGVVTICTLGFMMGMADDAYNTKPWLKFFIQVLCGIILIFTDNAIQVFDRPVLDNLLTVLWVVGIMNSVNMLDNMDAITGITSIMSTLGALVYLYIIGLYDSFYFVIILGVLASLLGFLYFNWHPSKMYMGDTGSQFLGAFLAVIAIKLFWNGSDFQGMHIQTKQILTTLLFFIVPIADTTTVSINRIMSGKSPFVGGKDHTTHHLAYLGFKDRQVAIILGFVSLVSIVIVLAVVLPDASWSYTKLGLISAYALIVIAGLYSTTRFKKSKNG